MGSNLFAAGCDACTPAITSRLELVCVIRFENRPRFFDNSSPRMDLWIEVDAHKQQRIVETVLPVVIANNKAAPDPINKR